MFQSLRLNCQRLVVRFKSHLKHQVPNSVAQRAVFGGALRSLNLQPSALKPPTAWGSRLGMLPAAASLHSIREYIPENFQLSEMGVFGWFLLDLVINWVGFGFAWVAQTEKFYDLVGSLSFLTCTVASLIVGGASGSRKILVSCMVGAWAVRLGTYLVVRVFQSGKDGRFDTIKKDPVKFFTAWTLQAVWAWMTLLPVLIINGAKASAPLTAFDIAGIFLYLVGYAFEAGADWQKNQFRQNPENKGKFITTGLWSVSRHPNYFGEFLIWWGIFFTCVPGFTAPLQYASVVSPLFVMLIINYVSGIPMLEETADKRWGHLPEYQEYKAKTPVLVPLAIFKDTHTQ